MATDYNATAADTTTGRYTDRFPFQDPKPIGRSSLDEHGQEVANSCPFELCHRVAQAPSHLVGMELVEPGQQCCLESLFLSEQVGDLGEPFRRERMHRNIDQVSVSRFGLLELGLAEHALVA